MKSVIWKANLITMLLIYVQTKVIFAHEENKLILNYLKNLNKIAQFANANKDFLGVNLGFGLFLAKVNLAVCLKEGYRIPKPIFLFILNTIYEIDESLIHFREQVFKTNNKYNLKLKNIVSLLNDTSWIDKIKKYEEEKLDNFEKKSILCESASWEEYLEKVNDVVNAAPSPRQSDTCLSALGENQMNLDRKMTRCKIYDGCYEIVLNGSNCGFSITHRLLIILVGHFGRNCYIFSKSRDEALILEICASAFKEAQYVAEEGYMLRDLMMEQVALCTLNGFNEYIQFDWMAKFLQLQSNTGCFGAETSDGCHEHVTAVAAASIAAALRFIIQDTYEEI